MAISSNINIAIGGLGGYGKVYLDLLEQSSYRSRIKLVAVAETNPHQSASVIQKAKAMGAAVFSSVDQMISSGPSADLVILATGFHEHADQAIAAMEAGSHVLCEKPVAATIQDALRMKRVADRLDKKLAVGYQLIFTKIIQEIKRRLLAGEFGKPLHLKYACAGLRSKAYYSRNNWAGRLCVAGQHVLDSPIQNCGAHHLNLMLYLSGPTQSASATPIYAKAALYRAARIQCYDTGSLRVATDSGCSIKYDITMASQEEYADMHIECESATIRIAFDPVTLERTLYVIRKAKVCEQSPIIEDELGQSKLDDTLGAIDEGRAPKCTIDNALQHVICTNGALESHPKIISIPDTFLKCIESQDGNPAVVLPHAVRIIKNAFEQETMLCDQNLPWAKHCGKSIDLQSYDCFPGKKTTSPIMINTLAINAARDTHGKKKVHWQWTSSHN